MFQDWSAREQLAAIAMHGILAGHAPAGTIAEIAAIAYKIADAMIEENGCDPQSRLSANETGTRNG